MSEVILEIDAVVNDLATTRFCAHFAEPATATKWSV